MCINVYAYSPTVDKHIQRWTTDYQIPPTVADW